MREDKIIQILTKTDIVNDQPFSTILGLSDRGIVYTLCTNEKGVMEWEKLIYSPCEEHKYA